MKKLSALLMMFVMALTMSAQRHTDKLDRGLVAVPGSSGGYFVSWRVFGEEYYGVTYNLYANGTKIASNLKVSSYTHSGGNANTKYQVAPVVNGIEQAKCDEVTPWAGSAGQGMLTIPVAAPTDRDGNDASAYYTLNDVSIGDLDGDGIVEFIVKRKCSAAADPSQKKMFHQLDCYDHKGNRLWWIDLGPNMLAGADEQWDCVCYDWDEDGKAEVLLRIQDNAYIHYPDGSQLLIGSSSVDTRWNGVEYTSSGNEYLLYLEGATGKPYNISGNEQKPWMTYPLTRGNDSDWGEGIVGHRSTKHYFGAPFIDGRHPSIFLGRGCYTKHKFAAYKVDPQTHQLNRQWYWETNNGSSPWFGNGYHNFAIGDVDWDGRDEIIFGSMVIDDNGLGLSTTNYGHGDAQHCSDFDPYRKYEEQFACLEEGRANYGNNYRNAVTSQIYVKHNAGGDDGRALMGNFTNTYPGSVGRSVSSGWISSVADKFIDALGGDNFISWGDLNQRIYWDGDLLDEYFDSPGTEGYGAIYKPNEAGGGRWNFPDSQCNNWTKNNPGGIADIFGDWREELIMRRNDNKAILVYTTGIPTTYRIPTLWHDHQYRNAMVWQSMGYNQPPHKSYFLGQLEGITQAPPPYTMTGRTEIKNGGTIGANSSGQLIVCETNDTKVTVEEGAAPNVMFFNVPSWVQGTAAGNSMVKVPPITYDYYTCEVSGGAFGGGMRLVKQGDGILTLPTVEQKYTGNTDIWAGTLNFDGKLKSSTLWLNRFAELNSDRGEFRHIKMDYASILRPGHANEVGYVKTDSLTLGFGSRVVFDVRSGESGKIADQVTAGYLSIQTKSGSIWENFGPKYLKPVFEINTGTTDKMLEAGKYIIGFVEELNGSINNIIVEGVSAKQKSYLTYEEGKIYLVIEDTRDATSVIWNGLTSNLWNLASAENFTLAADPESKDNVFVNGDYVTFNDDASKFSVTLNGELEADTVLVNNTKAYTFTGSGSMTGNTTFVKQGTGTLTINAESNYKGGTRLSGGTVKVNSLSNSTKEYGCLGGVNTAANKFVMENGAKLQNTSAVTMDSPMLMSGEEGGKIHTDGTFTMNKIISGTQVTKKGSGELVLYNTNSVKKMVIQAGTVRLKSGQPAAAVVMEGGTLVDDASNTGVPIEIPEGKNATFQLSSTYYLAYNNRLTGGGTLTINPTNTVSRVRITGNWSAFTGTIKHTNTSIWLPLDCNTGLPKGTLDIADGATVTNVVKSFTIGKLTGKGSLAHPIANFQNKNAVSGSNTWRVGNSDENLGNFTFDGMITDGKGTNKANFEKIGTCKMTVTGAWDNTGTVKVTEGQLQTGSKACLGTGNLTVAADGILSGTAKLTNSLFTISGKVIPGVTALVSSGVLSFGDKNVTFNQTGDLQVCAGKCATETANGCSALDNIGRLTMNGTVTVNLASNWIFAEGDSIRLWKAASFSGAPQLNPESKIIDAAQGLYWDDSRLSEGLLFVAYDPNVGIADIAASSAVKAQVISLNGSVVKTLDTTYGQLEQALSHSNLPTGVYLIRVSDGKATETRKYIKK